jgi:penicillin-binding protein 1A
MVRALLRVLAASAVAIVALGSLAAIAIWRELTQDLPAAAELLDYRPPTATRVLASDGTPIGEFYVERRYLVPIAQVPEQVRLAFLAAEDAEFYRHPGIDMAAIARAMIANVRRGEITQGASTITQQVVKQLLLSPERSIERKSKELILALELESKLTKDEIFYLYLNHIYFGAGTYGISAASHSFFDVEPGGLSLAQAALLAGLPQAPSRYDPVRHPEAARRRQRYVLDRMLAAGFVTPAEHARARDEPLALSSHPKVSYDAAPWYVQHVRTLLEQEYGSAFATLGLQVHTAVDLKLQAAAEDAVREGVRTIERRLGTPRPVRVAPDQIAEPEPHLEGALIAIDPESGEVKALVGGVDFRRSQFNRAVQAKRQPGSAFKPLLYAAALEHGYTATTIVEDAPISLPDGHGGDWTPRNFDDKYMGRVPLRTALAKSLNSVSVRIALHVGIDTFRDHLRIFGFPTEFPRNISLALGSSEVTLLDLTRAYAVFATLGRRFDPVVVTSVTDSNGFPSEFRGSHPRFERVMNPGTAYVVSDMMRGVVESGTAREAKKLGRPAAGKTGTTNDSMDAWFIGFTPDLVVGVWVGFDAERSLGSYTGGRAAAPIWTAFMSRALEGRPVRDFATPDDVTIVRVDAATGLLAVPGRASQMQPFVTGTEPTRSAPPPTLELEAAAHVDAGAPDVDAESRAARP